MDKISKTVPQKEVASSSRLAGEKLMVEPRLEELILGGCVIDSDFMVKKLSSVTGRCLGKDAVMRPSSGDEEALLPILKPEKASVLHHEAFLQFRGDLSRYEAEVQRLTEDRDAFKLLSEQREGEVKRLWAEFEASRKEHAELAEQVKRIFEFNDIYSGVMANSSIPQVEQKLDVIRKIRVEVDVVKSEAKEWKKNMDRITSEKETVRTQLASAEAQLRSLKEKTLVQAKKIKEFQSRLSSAGSDRERLATELAAAKS
ncbi:uncharacterized protein [Nicotiana tomentosiformis]|uniref:uncharacterized protein n=1 Tax=Nicotiana tomentosiformis TaxID=4098 RepID=UPI00388C81FD